MSRIAHCNKNIVGMACFVNKLKCKKAWVILSLDFYFCNRILTSIDCEVQKFIALNQF
jgi:hypothetical protein